MRGDEPSLGSGFMGAGFKVRVQGSGFRVQGWFRVQVRDSSALAVTDRATLMVRVIPRSGRTAFAGQRGEAVLVRLAAAPVEGAANDALVAFLSEQLGCPRRDISILSGAKSRDKRVQIDGLTDAELERRVAVLNPEP
jgi:uncharacterized protein (TIGR00251 family)